MGGGRGGAFWASIRVELPMDRWVFGLRSVKEKSLFNPLETLEVLSNASSNASARLSVASDNEISSMVNVGLGMRGAVAVVVADEVEGRGWRDGEADASGAGIADLRGSALSNPPQLGSENSGLFVLRSNLEASSERRGRRGG